MVATDTKSQILEAALTLFAEQGYEKTTIRSIAKRVGIQSASIYYFFDSKAHLLEVIFTEFLSDFAKYRNAPEDIWKAATEKPLSEVLSMLFYTFGSPDESARMMTIARVILSLQYEHAGAQRLLVKVMIQDALDYGIQVLKGLHKLGVIKDVDYQWTAYVFLAFAIAVFEDNLRYSIHFDDSRREYGAGIHFLCSVFAKTMER